MAEPVTALRRPLPEKIRMAQSLTPNEMRLLKAATGRSLTELIGGDAEDMEQAPDRMQTMIWIALRRAGYDVSWEAAGDVEPDMAPVAPDPTPSAS